MSLQGVSVAYGGLRPLSNLFSTVASDLDGRGNRLACKTRLWGPRTAIAAWGLAALIVVCWTPLFQAQFLAKTRWPYARMAKFLDTQMQNK